MPKATRAPVTPGSACKTRKSDSHEPSYVLVDGCCRGIEVAIRTHVYTSPPWHPGSVPQGPRSSHEGVSTFAFLGPETVVEVSEDSSITSDGPTADGKDPISHGSHAPQVRPGAAFKRDCQPHSNTRYFTHSRFRGVFLSAHVPAWFSLVPDRLLRAARPDARSAGVGSPRLGRFVTMCVAVQSVWQPRVSPVTWRPHVPDRTRDAAVPEGG